MEGGVDMCHRACGGVGENSAVDLSFALSLLPEVELGSLGQPILGF